MSPLTILKVVLLSGAALFLAGCQDSEAQAEEHYQSALALMEAGDTTRADVEFRNVFQLNGLHRGAREDYAAMLRRIGDGEQAYRQYLRLVEQFPDHVEGQIALAELALEFQNWEGARRHGRRVLELAPDAPEASAINVNLDYLDAVEAGDALAREAAFEAARADLEADPDNILLQRLVMDGLLRTNAYDEALEMVDRSLAISPDNRQLHDTRLQILGILEQPEALEAQLREMLTRFPEDTDLSGIMLRFHIARDDIDAALAFLRELAETSEDAGQQQEALAALVRLRLEQEGPEAGLEELDRIIADGLGDTAVFRALRAGIQFSNGDRDAAIAALEALLEEDGLTLVQRGQFRVALAQMLLEDGNIVGARRLVEVTLEEDASQADALRMLAAWQIEEDNTDRAILNLRRALDVRPNDSEALTLMAAAHERAGNPDLTREFLSLAVEASGGAPGETIRYVNVLLEDGRARIAEEFVIDALRLAPRNSELLTVLGRIYLQMEDWSRAEHVERTLRESDAPGDIRVADQLRSAILTAQGRTAEALSFLEDLAGAGESADTASQIAVVQARLSSGDVPGAVDYASQILADDPENPVLRFILAAAQSAAGANAEAADLYRGLVAEDPERPQAWMGLIRALAAQGEDDAAAEALADALQTLPDAPDLLWAQASYLERAGDYEGAIALYEQLYEIAPNALVVANNLASLISSHREDDDSLNRAYEVGRRLRGSDVAPFQDTYGWIAYRRGEYEEALDHLEPAARELSDDPLVQYHLGMVYLELERSADALEQLQRAVDLAGPDDNRAQFAVARAQIEALEAAEEGTDADPAD